MRSDIEIARLLIDLYAWQPGAPYGSFDFIEPGIGDHGICWALKSGTFGELDDVFLRGSRTFTDWIRDFIALANPFQHGTFGPIHPGFYIGMPECFAAIRSKARPGWRTHGHSLGAGRGRILMALMKQAKIFPISGVLFGEPKSGFQQLADYVKNIPVRSYRNGSGLHHDLVTDVPLTIPPEEYVHAGPLINLQAAPVDADEWGPFAWHHMELYAKGLECFVN